MRSPLQLIIAFWVTLALAITPRPGLAAQSRPGYRSSFAPIASRPRAKPRSPGAELWVERYNGVGAFGVAGSDVATSVGTSPDGSKVFVTGGSVNPRGKWDYTTIAYDARGGTPLWVQRYNGPDDGSDNAVSLGVSPDGSKVFVTGTSERSPGEADLTTVAYDSSTGEQLWAERYSSPGTYEYAYSIQASPDGSKVFVTGTGEHEPGNLDFLTVAYDISTGDIVWVDLYDGPDNSADIAHALGLSPDGSRVFVTGESFSPDTWNDYLTVAFDASTGARLWTKRYNGPANIRDFALSLGVSPDGSSLFVTGHSDQAELLADYATVAYDASTGAQLWVERYDGPLHGDDWAFSLGVSPDGIRVFVTGYSVAQYSHADYTTIAYDTSSGAMLWLTRYIGPRPDKRQGQDGARALGVSPDGSQVFVTGLSEAKGGNYDYATVAYGAFAGTQLWVQRYEGPGHMLDYPHSLSVSPDGSRIFVTGESVGSGSDPEDPDYATVAYSTT